MKTPETRAFGDERPAVTPIEMVGDFLKAVRGRQPDDAEVAIVADKLHALGSAEDRA